MRLFPAVDIRGGQAVRLYQGDYGQETVYNASPLEAAKRWIREGADALHVVDLDGAKEGRPVSLDHVRQISELGVYLQLGGGVRALDHLTEVFEAGASSVLIGTAAFSDQRFLEDAVAGYGHKIVVSVDDRDGTVAVAGWLQDSQITPAKAAERLTKVGVRNFVYTSISRDGTLEGPDLEGLALFADRAGGGVVYAGGIGELAHIEELADSKIDGLEGVIVGKALYEGKFTVTEAREILERA